MHYPACRNLLPGLALLVLSLPAAAQVGFTPGEWRKLGPDGGTVTDLIVAPSNPQVLYATAQGALHKSVNGGASWNLVGDDNSPPAFNLAIDAANPSLLYARQFLSSVRSLDGGKTWGIIDVPGQVNQWVGHPKFARTVFAATEKGLFRSANAGSSWKAFRSGFPARYRATRIVIDSTAPRRIYVAIEDLATGERHILKSLDGGTSWQPIDNGPLAGKDLLALATHPRSSQILYAAVAEGVYKSTDGGRSWRSAGSGVLGHIRALVVHPARPDVVYAGTDDGLFRSQNGGTTWIRLSQGLPELGSVSLLVLSRQTLLASVSAFFRSGVFRSSDSGSSWTFSGRGISALEVSFIDFGAPGTIWIVADGILFRSTDRGLTWRRIQPDPANRFFSAATVAVDPTDRSNVFVMKMATDGEVWRSEDAGNTWEAAGNAGLQPFDFVIDPQTPSTLYAAGIFSAGVIGIAKSTDRGATWTQLPFETGNYLYLDLAIAPSDPSTLYAATSVGDDRASFWRTTDGGNTWTRLSFVAESFGPPSLAVDPLVATTVTTTDRWSVRKSTDGGETWAEVVGPPFETSIIAPLAISASGRLYAAVWDEGIFTIEEGDPLWSVLDEHFDWAFTVLAADPHDPCLVYMGGQFRGLLVFTHSGTAECGAP